MAQWIYIKGCAKDFEGAPDWALMRTRAEDGHDYFVEGHDRGCRFIRLDDLYDGFIDVDVEESKFTIIANRRVEKCKKEIFGGVKLDSGKLRMSLMPVAALNEILSVLEFGAQKYAPDNWRKVDNARERYYNAAHRHLSAWWAGERNDPESGLHHLAHCACCVIFLLATEMEGE